jgi:cation:H+ antiporter
MLTAGFLKECPQGLDDVADILLLSSVIPLVLVIAKVPTGFIGVGLLSIFAFSVYRQIRTGARSTKSTPNHSGNNPQKITNKPLTMFKILFGTLVILVTARFTVSSALEIAAAYSILPIFIGALIVAFGTSLPELSLSIMAVKHGRTHLASANAIGSNLTNLTLILGIVFLSSFFSPFPVDITPFFEIIAFVLITSLIIWYHITKGGDCRLVGMVLILAYVIFQVVIILG